MSSPAQSFWRTNPIQTAVRPNAIQSAWRPVHRSPFHLHLSRVLKKKGKKITSTSPPVAVVLLLPRSVLSPAGRLLMASPPPVAADGHHSVFVYGTLMAEEVVRVLLGRAPPSSPALLPDHRRFSIRGRVYPAILPARGHAVSGKVRVRLSPSTCQP